MKQVTFIDQARIKIRAGRGGDGMNSFHREKYVEHGGPSGGHGGNGGSIFFVATKNQNTLLNFRGHSLFKAENGVNGAKNNMTGARGEDLIIPVPTGTELVFNEDKKADLVFDGQLYLAEQGGQGGRGNASFKSSKNTTPMMYELGEEPEWMEVQMNLKVLADIGLLGYPNAGKSTFLSVISNAKPKIADYQFTTLIPQLGQVKHQGVDFVVTDLPGLIDGASEDKGMGHEFLKHLSRTKLLLHMIDGESGDYKKKYSNLRTELKKYSLKLSLLPELIVITKDDLIDDDEIKNWIAKDFDKDIKLFFISAIQQKGIKELLDEISIQISKLRIKEEQEILELVSTDDFVVIKLENEEESDPLIIRNEEDVWYITNQYTQYWAKRIPISTSENQWRIYSKLKSKGYIRLLEKKGIRNGQFIVVEKTPFIMEYKSD